MSAQETTGEAMTRALIAHSIDTVFGIPGAHMYDFTDALYGVREKIRFINTRHEQGAAYMAYGYAKSTGGSAPSRWCPGPACSTPARLCAPPTGRIAPVLCLTGNIMSHLIGQGRGQLHDCPISSPPRAASPRSPRASGIPPKRALSWRSHRQNVVGPPGPRRCRGAVGRFRPTAEESICRRFTRAGTSGDGRTIAAAAELIAAARNPLIMVGAGA